VTLDLLPAHAIRARYHPWIVVGLWAWQLLLAFIVSGPAALLVGASYGRGLDGDAILFKPGGRALLSLLLQHADGVRSLALLALIVWAIGSVVGLIPLAIAITALSHRAADSSRASLAECSAIAIEMWPKLVRLLGALVAIDALLLGAGYAVAMLAASWTHQSLGEARSEQVALGVACPFVLAAIEAHVVHDLSRAFLVCAGGSTLRAVESAARALCQNPAAISVAWAWRVALSGASVIAAAVVTGPLASRSAAAFGLLTIVDQLVVLIRVSLRTSWLARSLRAIIKDASDCSRFDRLGDDGLQ
jgi:hypothetical protein